VRTIAIVLAIYDGEKFLEQQLESIVLQDHQKWSLYVRDDGSHDDSRNIVEQFSKVDKRVHVLTDAKNHLGARDNFASLMERRTLDSYPYIAFSDQDDVWQHDKLSMQLDVMHEMERHYSGTALLVHSDMTVVDASLNMIDPSFMDYQGIRHEENAVPVLLAQNFVTGCTALVNRTLLDIALPLPEEALMHDWWLALCAAVFGHIGYIDKPLVRYRQHGNNEVGAKHPGDYLNPLSGEWRRRWLEGRDHLFQSMKQAQALADRIREHAPDNPHLALVEAYASLQKESPLKRIRKLRDLGVHTQSKTRQALLLSRLLLTPQARNG